MTPFYGWGSTVSRLQSHCEEEVYLLPHTKLVVKACFVLSCLVFVSMPIVFLDKVEKMVTK